MNLTPAEVHAALQANNYLAAVGKTKGSMIAVNLVANTDLKTAEEFRSLVIRQDKGAIVRLGDVADVVLGAESYDDDVRFSGQKATFMGVWPLPNANTLDVVRSVREAMPEIQSRLPAGMQAGIAYDATVYIRKRDQRCLKDAERDVAHRHHCHLPLHGIAAHGDHSGCGHSDFADRRGLLDDAGRLYHQSSHTVGDRARGGLVVDDAIVVVENVERHLQEGENPLEAALKGARELVGPIIAMTITLAAVYTPIGIQGGLTGALFREFAFTLAGAVIVSGVVALTLSPMMSSKLLREGDAERGFAGWINRQFDRLRNFYMRVLGVTVRQPLGSDRLLLGDRRSLGSLSHVFEE